MSAVVEARAAKVAMASGLSMGLSVALQLISVPVCLHFWGQETYGLWLALLALASMIRTLDAGFTAYVGNQLNVQYHRDLPQLRETLASALWGALLVGAIELLLGVLVVISGTLPGLLGVPEPVASQGRAGAVLVIMLLGFVVTAPYLGVVHRLMVPAGMLYQATWWFMGLQIVQTAALVLAAGLEYDLIQAAALFALSQAIIHVASAAYIARKLPEFFPWWRQRSMARGLRDLLHSSVMSGANVLIQAGTNGVVMLVSSGLGAAAVPVFTTVRTLSTLWTTLGNALTTPLLPEVVRYHALNDSHKLVAALETHWLIANALVNLSILAGLPLLDDVYRAWTGGRVALDAALLCTMLLAVVVATPGSLIMQYLVGINDLRAATAIYAVRGLIPLACGFALLPRLGATGVAIGVALGELLGPVVVGGAYLRRQLRIAGGRVVPRWQPIALGSASTAAYLILHAVRGFSLAAYVAALVAVLASIAWGWGGQSHEVRVRVLRLLRRRVD